MTADESKDNDNEERTTVGDIIHDFWETSTLQGLPRVFTSKAVFWKLFWLFMFVLLMIGCTYQMYSIFEMFYARETYTSVSLAYGDIGYPSVTICNKNMIRESQFLKHAGAEYNNSYMAEKSEPDGRRQWPLMPYIATLTDTEIERDGHQLEMMFDEVFYRDHSREGWSLVQGVTQSNSTSQKYGNCYTLNSAKASDKTYIARKPGKTEGIDMQLYAEYDEYLYMGRPSSRSSGFIMDVHPFNSVDNVDNVGIDLPTGFETAVKLRMVIIDRLEPPYGECSKEYAQSYEELYNFTYSVQACNHSCESYQIAEQCGCYRSGDSKFNTPHQLNTLPKCNTTRDSADSECIESIIREVHDKETLKCTCPLSCHEVSYDVEISIAPLTADTSWGKHIDRICRRSRRSPEYAALCEKLMAIPKRERLEYVRNNIAAARVYFRELTYQSFTEHIAYERSQFISDFGGNLGLWLGASIFTVLEIVELVTKITCKSASNKKNKQRGRGNPQNDDGDVIHNEDQGIPLKDNTAEA